MCKQLSFSFCWRNEFASFVFQKIWKITTLIFCYLIANNLLKCGFIYQKTRDACRCWWTNNYFMNGLKLPVSQTIFLLKIYEFVMRSNGDVNNKETEAFVTMTSGWDFTSFDHVNTPISILFQRSTFMQLLKKSWDRVEQILFMT